MREMPDSVRAQFRRSMDERERFESFVRRGDGDGCDTWIGYTTGNKPSREGHLYGQFVFCGKKSRAHRVAWRLAFGDIPDGMMVCHRCDNPSCVKPSHLFLGTASDNQRDSADKGRTASQRRELCPRGHRQTRVHAGRNGRPRRACAECHREANHKRYWRDVEASRERGRARQRDRSARGEGGE